MTAFRKRTLLVCGLVLAVIVSTLGSVADEPAPAVDLSQYYGFLPLEIYKLERRSRNMLAADLNHDQKTDLVLADNSNSRLDLLLQRDPAKAADEEPESFNDVNHLSNDKRFEHVKVSVDKEIASLTAGDFNSDGQTDLAYFGDADQLIVRYQGEDGSWQTRKRFRLPDVNPAPWNTAAGDLNGDGKTDLAVLGQKATYIIYQNEEGKLHPPRSVMNTSEKLVMVRITDLDGDGRADLCYESRDEGERPLCVRFQNAQGRLGPESRFEIELPRASVLYDIDGKPGDEILTIESRTGRVKIHRVVRPQTAEGELAGQLVHYGYGSGSSSRNTDIGIGDLDGDGLTDVVVTDPSAAQVVLFRQHPSNGLDQGQAFPSLTDAQQVRVGDLDGDKKSAEVIVLSRKEKAIGYSRLAHGRLSFPIVLPLEKEPVAIELADINGDGREELLCIVDGKSSPELHAMSLQADGEWKPAKFGEEESIAIKIKGKPERLMKLDANADGRIDYLVFAGSEPELLLTDDSGVPQLLEQRRGLGLGRVDEGALFASLGQNPMLLVSQQNFARQMLIDDLKQWQVVDQFNATESKAKIVGAAPINLDDNAGHEIVLVDTGVNKLRILREEENLYRPWREVEIGDFRYHSVHKADLNNDGREDLLLFGIGRFGVLYAGHTDPELVEVASYETKLEDARFADLVAGDLNSDGYTDIACIDTKSQLIEILDFAPETGLRHGFFFKVFEAKGLNAPDRTGVNPREGVIADVTGDGRNDLILLSHDRVLLYPQDSGE